MALFHYYLNVSGPDLTDLSSYFKRSYKQTTGASLITQLVKNPPAMQETPVQFLGQTDPLEKGMVTHFSILGLALWLSW